jgi:acyl dehydratase
MTEDAPTTELSSPGVVELDRAPSLARLFAKAPLATRERPAGLVPVELILRDVAVNRDHLADYDRVCGFTVRDELPATFPHVLAFPLQMTLMVDHPFPLSLAKLVHVGNRITAHRSITADERLSFRVHAGNLRAHPKGSTVDLVCEGSVDGEVVWHGVSTYLQRGGPGAGGAAPEGGDGAPSAAEPDEPTQRLEPDSEASVPDEPTAFWTVPRDIGRRYAAVSGDRNPIHLTPLAAKLAGFPRTIAHGMWTKARCLAAVESRLPPAFTVDVAFKKPIVLPARVGFATRVAGSTRHLAVRDAGSGAPHLLGRVGTAG